MKSARLGCFTASGILASLITAIIISGFAFASGGMLFNAGGLNAHSGLPLGGVSSHAEIAGKCALCHAAPWSADTMADRCAACHTNVAAQWQDPSTLHGVLRENNPKLACRNCHPDHRGQDSPLIDLSNTSFPHNTFSFLLNSHQTKSDGTPFSCNDCHAKVYTSFDEAICSTCHTQIGFVFMESHTKDFGSDCLACHDGQESYGNKFDHTSVPFQLSGKHVNVKCTDCHPNAKTIAVLKSTPQDCNTCHKAQDPHEGRYGSDCGSCHTENSWSPAKFDHNLSTFILTGKHSSVPCENCHADHVFVGTPKDCNACHAKKDVHQGSLGILCATCHTTESWKPSTYDHIRSNFALTGAHTKISCTSCHANNLYKDTPSDCFSCHQKDDRHSGQLGTECGSCHSFIGWKPATYNHNLSTFKLTGAHSTAACSSCHTNNLYKGTASDCNSCHQKDDQHKGQLGTSCSTCHSTNAWKPATYNHNQSAFKLTGSHTTATCVSCHTNSLYKGTPSDCNSCHKKDDTHTGQLGTSCSTCHNTSAWKPSTFNHSQTTFILTGAHTTATCVSCHPNNVFKSTSSDCYGCHKQNDNHNGQYGTSCSTCHTTSAWKPATFDHNQSTFKLTGKHATVACTSCHANNVYKGTPSDCNACHKSDDPHAGQFGTNCSSCHATNGWLPASFDHNLSTYKLTGVHVNVECTSCHINNVYKGTPTDCYSCHKVDDPHGGQYGTNCGNCHTTSGWLPATFDHNLSSFKLTGAHVNVNCSSCHVNSVYKGTPSDCYSCHKGDDQHSGQYGTNCGSCHTTSNWSSATFDHNLASFKLTGAHANASCSQCHSSGVYKGLSTDCVSCHAEPAVHKGQFGTDCAQCHTTSNWDANFNHPDGCDGNCAEHRNATCQDCHPNNYSTYTCLKCHDSNKPGD